MVDLNLRSLRYLLFKIFRRRFCYGENTVSRRFAPARRSMRRLGVSWAASLPGTEPISQKATPNAFASGRRKPRFLWTVDLNLRSLRYLLFKIFRRRFCYGENTVSRRFAPARRSMRRLGVSWAASLCRNQFREGAPPMPRLRRR
jgi:hypothetical protein